MDVTSADEVSGQQDVVGMSKRKRREKTNAGERSRAARYTEQSIGRREQFAELGSGRYSDARLAELKVDKLDIEGRRDGSITHRKSACRIRLPVNMYSVFSGLSRIMYSIIIMILCIMYRLGLGSKLSQLLRHSFDASFNTVKI